MRITIDFELLWRRAVNKYREMTCERQYCPRREESWQGQNTNGNEKPDYWYKKPNGDRCCSYCGSLHFDDMRRLVKKCLVSEDVSIEPSDKNYKVYVRQAGVKNAGEGAIKFYMQHVPKGGASDEDNKEYGQAVRLSSERYRKQREEWVQSVSKKTDAVH